MTPASTSLRPFAEPTIWRAGAEPADIAPAALRGAVLAIGNFDGVHLGHKALLAAGRRLAADLGAPLAVMTFEPHPRSVFRPDEPVFRLSSADVRATLLGLGGVSGIAQMRFDRTLAAMEARAFVDDLLLRRLGVRGVVVGGDFRFGRGRAGDVALLGEMLGAAGARLVTVDPVSDAAGGIVSSSRIRDALAAGDIAGANALLGHGWMIRAEVAHGDKRGRELGYPTANMLLPPDNRLRHGIYGVAVLIDGVWRPGAASFGRRPTFDNGAPRLESYIFDFSGDLYGRRLDLVFGGFIRGEEKFDDIEALRRRMGIDCDIARQITHTPPADADFVA